MVLYKRKPVIFSRPPEIPQDLSQEVWYIPQTKEWFLEYGDYLARMDYYMNRKFVCEITGNSCLTFFEALKSESVEILEVEKNFPESLKEHILRFLQFNQISRLDQLVDKVYSNFKNDYFPGETIFIKGVTHLNQNGEVENINESIKQRGIIREKVQYGQSNDVTTKYLVVRLNDQSQSIVTNDQIARDRNHFTKWLIKTFIKLSVCRSHKVGAPWVVKEKYCRKYRIPKKYPDNLIQYMDSTPTGETLYEPIKKSHAKASTPTISSRPSPISISPKKQPIPSSDLSVLVDLGTKTKDKKKYPTYYLPEAIYQQNQNAIEKSSLFAIQPNKKNIVDDLKIRFDVQNPKPTIHTLMYPKNSQSLNRHIIKELAENEDDYPNLKDDTKYLRLLEFQSVQQALQCWAFLNIYHTSLNIDTFTFDDFIYSMGWNFNQYDKYGRCELLDEIWCAVLCAILSSEPVDKKQKQDEIVGLLVNIPPKKLYESQQEKQEKDIQDHDEGIENTEDLVERNEVNHEESINNGKAKQSEDSERGSDSEQEEKTLKSDDDDDSLDEIDSKKEPVIVDGNGIEKDDVEDENDDDEEKNNRDDNDDDDDDDDNGDDDDGDDGDDSDDSDDEFEHHAYSMMNHRKITWHERLRKRNFKDGNWQTILLGVLSLIEHVPHYQPTIQKIFKLLAPKSMVVTASTALTQFYDVMSIDLRIQALNILIDLLATGTVVRKHIEESLEASTVFRRSRLDSIRDYKVQLEIAQKANSVLYEKLSNHRSCTPVNNKIEHGDEPVATVYKRPRLNFKAFAMTEEESALASKDKEFAEVWNQKKDALLKLEEIKKEKREFENKLTELDCQRVRLLGKDRLLNRYWWFENNGLPTLRGNSEEDEDENDIVEAKDKSNEEDENDDEVLNDTYLMGRLWIQGPSKNDLQVHFGSDYDFSQKYNILKNEYELEFNKDITISDSDVETQDQNVTERQIVMDQRNNEANGNAEVYQFKTENDEKIREMDFTKLPKTFTNTVSDLYGLQYGSKEIKLNNKVIIDDEGGLKDYKCIENLTPWQRKAIEEQPYLLANGSNWGYYDKPEEINKLIQWLNPWGKRESLLRKEIINIKDSLVSSMEARRKALWIDGIPTDELKLQNNIDKVKDQIRKLEAEGSEDVKDIQEVSVDVEDDDNAMSNSRKRPKRNAVTTNKKRKKLETTQEIINSGNSEDLKNLLEQLNQEFEQKKKEFELNRAIEWVNSYALDKFEKSLYEGGDKKKQSKSRRKN